MEELRKGGWEGGCTNSSCATINAHKDSAALSRIFKIVGSSAAEQLIPSGLWAKEERSFLLTS
ncbi:hypothetical protein EYF80_053653 [Liparis tanakae]|uniref:Uncharacterized protein n=1 Tax=Liparis tanakae TaxID=230148 RepID=A0A4Z2F5S5_9TELE|nr:hypothetical protein EYF80_053653 [Liparis tanakae]